MKDNNMRPFLLMAAFAAAFFMSAPALSQHPTCTSRSETVAELLRSYGETRVGLGITGNGDVIEILASEGGESWTIILTMPNGVTCMIAAGNSWELLPLVSKKSRGL
jgi:hypothetical protein